MLTRPSIFDKSSGHPAVAWAQSNGNFGNWLKAGLFGVPPMVSRSTSKPVPSARCLPRLKSLLMKTAGLTDVLRTALAPLADHIDVAFVHGSIARGNERQGSDVDMMVVGDALFADVVAAIGPAQEQLQREVNPTVYPPAEFQMKLAAGHHFLKRVMAGNKVFLIGDERGLERLAEERSAD